ncbi:hypothetical protein Ddc_01289 [Ditylenchus destructor]|nr:hypothetical protein Ddc_01289 [Ditylenchus destructor]
MDIDELTADLERLGIATEMTPMDARAFIDVDNLVPTGEQLQEDDIIALVTGSVENEEFGTKSRRFWRTDVMAEELIKQSRRRTDQEEKTVTNYRFFQLICLVLFF